MIQTTPTSFVGAIPDAQTLGLNLSSLANNGQSSAGGIVFSVLPGAALTLTALGNLQAQLTSATAIAVTIDSAYNIVKTLPVPLVVGQAFNFQLSPAVSAVTLSFTDSSVTLVGANTTPASAQRWYQGAITQIYSNVGIATTIGTSFVSLAQIGATNGYTVTLLNNLIVPILSNLIFLNVTTGTLPSGWYPITQVTSSSAFTIAAPVSTTAWTATVATIGTVLRAPTTYSPLVTITAYPVLSLGSFTGGLSPSLVGLGNVDNTSDLNKPVSIAQAAINATLAPLNSPAFTGTVTGITAASVGLGNVNNTSDANKPVSSLQATALALKTNVADLIAAAGAALMGWIQIGVGAIFRLVRDKLREQVSVKDFGAIGDGVTDDTAAIQAAINTGVLIIFPYGIYKITTPITYTGRVLIRGNNSTILGDGQSFNFLNASNSDITDIKFLPVTVPFTILRDPSVWNAVPAQVVQSFQGYMPSSQDADIWSGLSASIQAQQSVRPYQRPGIWFRSNSATPNTNVNVANITGYGTSVVFEGYQYSTVRNCSVGGNTGAGTVNFYNALSFDTTGTNLGYTLARGIGNKVINNNLPYGSYCGAVFYGNDLFVMSGNNAYLNGESGLKTFQHDGTYPNAVANTHGVISGNNTYYNYYDGIDAGSVYGVAGYLLSYNAVTGNSCFNNRASGITVAQSQYGTVSGNTCGQNGNFGINATCQYSSVTGNSCSGNSMFSSTGINNQWGTAQSYELLVNGDGNASTGNICYTSYLPNTYGYVHAGNVGAAPTVGFEGTDAGNAVMGLTTALYVSPTIPNTSANLSGKTGKINSGISVTLPSLNTFVTVVGSTTGMILLRDNTSGGTALFLFDPLVALVTVSNTIPGLVAQSSGGNFQLEVTSGTVPRNIGYLALLTQYS